jgi:hypothetical protein
MNKHSMPPFLAFCIAAIAAAAQGYPATKVSQEIIPPSSPVYGDMDALYLVTGYGTPSNARPWSKTEANLILSRVHRAVISGTTATLYDTIAARIEPGLRFRARDGFEFGLAADATLEAYMHGNADYDREADWPYGFVKRRPMVKFSLDFSLKDFFFVYCDLQYGRNRFNIADELYQATSLYPNGVGTLIGPFSPSGGGDNAAILVDESSIYRRRFLTNILEQSVDFDYQWPKRAVASVGGANWNLSLSRDKPSWGNGHSGNFIVDQHVDYQDFARLAAFSDLFKYDWLAVFFDTNPLPGEQPDTEFKVLLAHRLEFRILDGLTIAISEDMMYQNDAFDLRYVNPAFIYHNLNNRSMFNAIAHAELDFSFRKGFKLYAQAVIDQGRIPTESDAQADAKGYLGGIEYARVKGPGIFTSSLEFAWTDPLLYRRDRVDYTMFRKYYTNGNPTGPGYILSLDYVGYPYGGDAQVLQWDGAYRVLGMGTLGLRVFGMRHGKMDFFTSHNMAGDNAGYPDYEGKTPSGDEVKESLVASLSGEYELPVPLTWTTATLRANLDWINRRTYVKSSGSYRAKSSDLQFTLGCTLSF